MFILKTTRRDHLKYTQIFQIGSIMTLIYFTLGVAYYFTWTAGPSPGSLTLCLHDSTPKSVMISPFVCCSQCASARPALLAMLLLGAGVPRIEHPGYIHLALTLSFLLLLLFPVKSFFFTSRISLMKALRNIVISPFSKVRFIEFFLADQLCSLVRVLLDLEYITCFYFTGSFLSRFASSGGGLPFSGPPALISSCWAPSPFPVLFIWCAQPTTRTTAASRTEVPAGSCHFCRSGGGSCSASGGGLSLLAPLPTVFGPIGQSFGFPSPRSAPCFRPPPNTVTETPGLPCRIWRTRENTSRPWW